MKDYPPYLDYPKERKPQTNYDRLVSKTPEELAAWIADQPIVSDFDTNNSWHMAWLNWLKAPADKEGEG